MLNLTIAKNNNNNKEKSKRNIRALCERPPKISKS